MSADKNAIGKIIAAQGNLMTVKFEGTIRQNELVYVKTGGKNLKGEVIEINEDEAKVQVFEPTRGVKFGDKVEFDKELLSVELGPGLLKQVYDGLQNPLEDIAEEAVANHFLNEDAYSLAAKSAEKKMRMISNKALEKQRGSLVSHLQRQGFDWDIIKKVLEEIFEEK